MAETAEEKNGPAIAELAPDAHDCIMVKAASQRPTEYKAVTGFFRTTQVPLRSLTSRHLPESLNREEPSLSTLDKKPHTRWREAPDEGHERSEW